MRAHEIDPDLAPCPDVHGPDMRCARCYRRRGLAHVRIYEQGNGFPAAGDYCAGEGCLWLVKSIDSHIRTGDPSGNWVYATVSEADWSDCPEGDEHTARVESCATGGSK